MGILLYKSLEVCKYDINLFVALKVKFMYKVEQQLNTFRYKKTIFLNSGLFHIFIYEKFEITI